MFSALLKAPSFKLQIQIRLYVLLIKEKNFDLKFYDYS